MSVTDPSNSGSIFDIFRRGQGWQEISGYHVGDIQTDQSIWVMTGSTLVGNVSAARVRVDGLLFGQITAETTAVRPGGQVWGDVNTRSLEIEPGGKIHGWISTLGAVAAETLPLPSVETGSPNRENDAAHHMAPRNPEQVDALKNLQLEAAIAIAARAELEQSFDQRLTDMASEANARAAQFEEELTAANHELESLRPELQRLQEELDSRDNHINQQVAELIVARSLLGERQKDFDLLQRQYSEQTSILDHTTSARTTSETELEATRATVQELTERKNNLESALQASLLHTAELDESLVRWQELSETMETRANALEKEVGTLKLRFEESVSVTERLRIQRNQAKEAWESTATELMEIRAQINDTSHEARIAELEQELETQTAEVTKWRYGFEELSKRMRQLEQQRKGEQGIMQHKLQQSKARLSASEKEVDQYWQQADHQGRRLAELQALLVERDLQLNVTQETAVKQAQLIKKIKQLSHQQIHKLEQDLADARKLVAKLEAQSGSSS